MRSWFFLLSINLASIVQAQSIEKGFPKSVRVRLSNPLAIPREDVIIFISAEKIDSVASDFNPNAFVILRNGFEVPSQINLNDKDYPGIVFVLDKLGSKVKRISKFSESRIAYVQIS